MERRLGRPGPRAQALVRQIGALLEQPRTGITGGPSAEGPQRDALALALRDLAALARSNPDAVTRALEGQPRVGQALQRALYATQDVGP
jgi:hypothetical protein